ncbi:hypothetical protein [Rhizobium sp. MHM7A]|uniref:hypothetical protein n=1 Tax=Rhizobium sp. MHM7A TaxID=2583233 RepID=UPI0011070BE9|nr:hypothetical protein [Rhizobium sp. MHM7A]TLX16825.1 hypothetical protein FFR93_05625 [Rhizobium sp. MHM7A]
MPLIAVPFSGDQKELLAQLLDALDDEDLKRIARLDYGMDYDEHLAKLRKLRAIGPDGFDLDGYLLEVLSLCAWSEPSSDEDMIRVHRQRAFSCGLVYCSGSKPSDRPYTDETNLIQFIESLIVLGQPRLAVITSLCWLLSDVDVGDREGVFIGIALLMFALQEKRCSNDEILTLIDWIMRAGDAADMNEPGRRCVRGWDFGIDGRGRFNTKWRALMASLPGHVQTRHGSLVEEGVALLVAMTLPAVTEYI